MVVHSCRSNNYLLASTLSRHAEFAKNANGYPHEVVAHKKQPEARSDTLEAPAAPGAEFFEGRESTHRRAYQPYQYEMPTAFTVTQEHRRPRDDYTHYVEAILRQRQIFGMERR